MKKIIIICIFINIQSFVFAQVDSTYTLFVKANEKLITENDYTNQGSVIPPSPNAASLAIQAEVKVSEYTGIPSINIPIYTIKAGDITLPILLNYYASGIKVEQEASFVGLGWSLSFGGCITRQIRGLDDFIPGGYASSDEFPLSGALSNVFTTPETSNEINELSELLSNCEIGSEDPEPDIFYYNFNGNVGKLIFERQSSTILSGKTTNQSAMDFLYDLTRKTWEVTDVFGLKYYFGTGETIKNYSCTGDYFSDAECYTSPNNGVPIINAWYIDSIKSPNGFLVKFEYDDNTYRTMTQFQYAEYSHIYITNPEYVKSHGNISEYTRSRQEINDVYLKKITFPNGKIIFNTSERLDMKGKTVNDLQPQKLESIDIYSGEELIKTFDFSYSYFNQSSGTSNRMRLKLDSITESDGTSLLPPYKFIYNTTSLPSKTSFSRDYWGYYNGKDNSDIEEYTYYDLEAHNNNLIVRDQRNTSAVGKTLIPRIEFTGRQKSYLDGADREPNKNYVQAGILKKIKYPTGGSTEYSYESNYYSTEWRDEQDYQVKRKQRMITFFDDDEAQTLPFSLNNKTMVFFDYRFHDKSYSIPNTHASAIAVVKNSSGNEVITFKPTPENGDRIFETQVCVYLPAGDYEIYVYCPDDPEDANQIIVTYYVTTFNVPRIGSGVRISKLINYDENGYVANIEEYNYENDDGYTTGKSMSLLKHSYNDSYLYSSCSPYNTIPNTDIGGVQYASFSDVVNYFGTYNVITRASLSNVPLGSSAQGSWIGYDRVTKHLKTLDGKSNGKIVYYFQNQPESIPDHFSPGLPAEVHHDNGNLLRKEICDSSSNLVQLKMFNYKLDSSTYSYQRGLKLYSPWIIKGTTLANSGCLTHALYNIKLEWRNLVSDSTNIYSSDGSKKYTTVVNKYDYDNSEHKLLTKKTTVDSKGDSIKTAYRYPVDIGSDVYSSMTTLNMLNYPIEQTISRNGSITGSKLTTYKSGGGSYVPDEVYLLEATSPLPSFTDFTGSVSTKDTAYGNPEIEFLDYDSKGNLLKSKGSNGIFTYYLWAYNGQYPIAKIESTNASLGVNSIQTSINSSLTLSGSDSKTAIDTDIANIKTAIASISDGFVAIYTYKPLVGMTSETDPAGRTTYYEYDDFGRLKYVRDQNGNIIKRHEYRYATQTTN